jgi:hypothetical protein
MSIQPAQRVQFLPGSESRDIYADHRPLARGVRRHTWPTGAMHDISGGRRHRRIRRGLAGLNGRTTRAVADAGRIAGIATLLPVTESATAAKWSARASA